MKFVISALLGYAAADHANSSNPFEGATIMANPTYTNNVRKTESDHPGDSAILKAYENIGAATWIDNMANINKMEPVL